MMAAYSNNVYGRDHKSSTADAHSQRVQANLTKTMTFVCIGQLIQVSGNTPKATFIT